MENFVTFELAKKLKEKGFTCELPFAMYNELGKFYLLTTSAPYYVSSSGSKYREYYGYDDFDECDFIAPTIYQVLKWLREKYIDIAVYPIFIYEPNLNRIYETEIHTPQLNKSVKLGYYRTWEEAITEGIYYAITKLKLNKI